MFTNDIEKRRFQEKYAKAIKTNNFSKVAASMSPYIKVRTYENSVCTAILKKRTVQSNDLIPEEGSNDTFYVFGQVEQPTREAVPVNFRGQSTTFIPNGRRFKIPLGRHMSKVTKKSQDELMAWDYDLFQDLNEKDIFELHTLRDKKFLNATGASVIQSQKFEEYPLTGNLTVVRPDRIHFTASAQLLESGTRTGLPDEDTLKATKHLMGSQIWHDLKLWESEGAGSEHVSEVTINGYPATKILGINYITSIKNRLYVEKDAVMYLTMSGVGTNGETLTIDGTVFTWETDASQGDDEIALGSDAATAATAVYDALSAVLDSDIYEVTNPSDGVVRLRKRYDDSWKRFGSELTIDESSSDITNGTLNTGYDYWDHIWTFPDEDYVGEWVQIAGQEIETDIWKERGEKTTHIHRRSTEFSGGAIGNINGVALARLQRSKYTI